MDALIKNLFTLFIWAVVLFIMFQIGRWYELSIYRAERVNELLDPLLATPYNIEPKSTRDLKLDTGSRWN